MTRYSKTLQRRSHLVFQKNCHKAVVLGYNAMMLKPSEFKQRKENKISFRLLYEMKRLPFLTSKGIIASREDDLDNDEILYGDKEAEEADRIDFIFSINWKKKMTFEYHGEAKNLSLKSWKKSSGAKVGGSKSRGRYIDTGIERLMFGKYADLDGFLIGYVVNGSAKDNIVALNKLIKRRKLPPKVGLIENQYAIEKHTECYVSKNIKEENEINLHHLFLEFDKSK